MRLTKNWADAMNSHVVAEAMVCSKALAWSDRLMISTVHFPILRSA